MSKELVVTHQQALQVLEKQDTPEAKAILDYVENIKKKNIAILGVDEAFVLQNSEGQIKAFKKSLTLSAQDGTLIQPLGYGDHVLSAQGYEVWAEATGTSVIFPKEVLVGNVWGPNPYAERDETNRRILAVHARAIAFKYSSMGIPQISDWTTIFDTPSYRMIDLLAKAKKFPQAFKVLPKDIEPKDIEPKDKKKGLIETWAHYPFDESMNLWINTSHDEVITWLSQILNREKKAMDFAQTFAKRNALKHLSGLQKVPNFTGNKNGPDAWRFPVLAWRPTGNNIVKWDAAQYASLQDRVAGMIEGGGSEEFKQKVEIQQGSERASEDEDTKGLEAETDPEDQQEVGDQKQQQEPSDLPKEIRQAVFLASEFPDHYKAAAEELGIKGEAENLSPANAVKVCSKISEFVDMEDN